MSLTPLKFYGNIHFSVTFFHTLYYCRLASYQKHGWFYEKFCYSYQAFFSQSTFCQA